MVEQGRTVLVVDDLPEIADFFAGLGRRLASQGITIETETDPRRGLERLASHRYHVVVSDFRMPEVDGIEVLRTALRTNPKGYRILMTGYNEIPTPVSRIAEARVDAYLQKPLRVQDLMLLLLDFVHENERAITLCRQHAREIEQLGYREDQAARSPTL